jgi:hypothetical protein
MKRPRQVISKFRFFSEFSEQDDNAIVPSFARIAKLRGCCCIAMSSSLMWFVIIIPLVLFGLAGLTGEMTPFWQETQWCRQLQAGSNFFRVTLTLSQDHMEDLFSVLLIGCLIRLNYEHRKKEKLLEVLGSDQRK